MIDNTDATNESHAIVKLLHSLTGTFSSNILLDSIYSVGIGYKDELNSFEIDVFQYCGVKTILYLMSLVHYWGVYEKYHDFKFSYLMLQ